ncbi:MAG TPA: N-acetylmuramoyl-L-alanine amidase [Candidatus Sulfotelmatobacter sp.]|jgi:N-acetylmuramoyl-L-alanine amidase|nr:N-acetylmuramoyl-L-alanine amidase [Candidatus Sulfotelmatobacter sp.]
MPSINGAFTRNEEAHAFTVAPGCPTGRSPDRYNRFCQLQACRTLRVAFVLALFLSLTIPLPAAPPEKHLSVYSTVANYSLPILQRQGRDYVGLLELLEPLGTVSAKSDGLRWRLHYNNILGEFTVDKTRARIQGRDADLSAKFLLENGRGLVPLASLNALLPRFLGGPASLHEESARLFVGNVATHFTASVAPDDPSRLVFQFTAPVNPSVATEPGKLHLTFNHEPVTSPASPTLTFGSKTIPSAAYSEAHGAAEITVTTNIPLIASFSSDGRTVTLAPAKSQGATSAPPKPSPPPPQNVQTAPSVATSSNPRRYFAIVDASHGGADRGEALSPTLAEKDVTLAFARRLRQELESRGITTLVLRDSDANLSLDERAFFANTTHAAVYIALHAASSGHGVRVYTALLPYADASDDSRGPFRSWPTAQAASIPLSQAAAASVAEALKKGEITIRTLSAPLRPLNNIVTAAIAVEVAPPASDVSALAAPDYQQLIAGAIANGINAVRAQLGAAP